MYRLDWYITRQIAIWTAIALLVLVSFRSINVLVEELGSLGHGDYQTLEILYVVLLRTPGYMYEVFPMSLLVGGLLALGGMARNQEITAMRAAGISVWRLFRALLKTGVLITFVALIIGEVLAPGMRQESEQLRAQWLKYPSILQTKYGVWVRDGDAFVNIQRIKPNGELRNIRTYHFNEDGSLNTMRNALRAEYDDSSDWVLRNVRETRFEGDSVVSQTMKMTQMEAHLDADMMSKLGTDPQILSIIDLYEYNSFLHRNEQSVPEYEIAFWSKLAIPVLSLLMLLLALPFTINNMRNVDVGRNLVAGALLGVLIYLVNKSAAFLALIYAVSPIAVAWVPVLLLATVIMLYMRRISG
jgi:lipopolysaccharide export system permease protein